MDALRQSQIAALEQRTSRLSARIDELLKSYHLPGAHDQGSHGKGGGGGRGGGGSKKRRGKASGGGTPREFEFRDEADRWGEENYAKWNSRLTEDEEIAAVLYQDEEGIFINRELRGQELFTKKDRHQYSADELREFEELNPRLTKNLDSALAKSRVPENIVVFRGGDSALQGKLKKGQTFTDKGFVSTSLHSGSSAQYASGKGATVMKIHVPEGSRGAYLPRTSFQEVLLPRNSKFKVLGSRKTRVGKRRVQMVEVELVS